MAFLRNLLLICAATWSHAATVPLEASVQVRNAPGQTVEDTYRAIRRGLAVASLEKCEECKVELPLEKSWSGATLLSVALTAELPEGNRTTNGEISAGIEVICQTCYIKGLATAELTIGEGFNASELVEGAIDDIRNETIEFAETFEDYLDSYVSNVTTNLQDGFDWDDFDFPTFPFSFDLDIPEIPEANLRFQFDDMELYLEVETTLSAGAAYEINLFASQSAVGIKVGPMLQLGVVLQVDLLLEVEGEINISNGFHVKLDDGVALDIALFGNAVSNMIFNGGQFEFLPVTIESSSVSIAAILRIGVHCGVEVEKPKATGFDALVEKLGPPDVSAGIEVAVFANVAEFLTKVTYEPDDEDCQLKVIQEYNLGVGALAGASIMVDVPVLENMTWGPVASVTTAVFTTTLAEACAIEATATSAQQTTMAPEKRQDLETTTLTTTTTTTGVSCKVTKVAMCPHSEQVSTRATITRTHVTAVPSGETATFPDTAFSTVPSTVAFGSQVKSIKAMSGSPTPYVEKDNDEDDGDHGTFGMDGKTGGVSNKVIAGVCIGLGIPILAAIIGAVIFFRRRKRYAGIGRPGAPMVAEPYTGRHNDHNDQVEMFKSPGGEVRELHR